MSDLPRRTFLKLTGAAMAAGIVGPLSGARPWRRQRAMHPIPEDKNLDAHWLASLFERGEPTFYRKSRDELRFIGMPVGGLFCGTVYLGGDGQLWLWDVLNDRREGITPGRVTWTGGTWQHSTTIGPRDGAGYVFPSVQRSPIKQGFDLMLGGEAIALNGSRWQEIEFCGQYPVGTVRYLDEALPCDVELRAYSPFTPLDPDDSGLPVVVCEFAIHNRSKAPIEAGIRGWMESYFASNPGGWPGFRWSNRPVKGFPGMSLGLEKLATTGEIDRPDVPIDEFDRDAYAPWTVEGSAFGAGPIRRADVPGYQGDVGGSSKRVVNSHASAPGGDIGAKDAQTGLLRSPAFTIERRFLNIEVGGGANSAEVGVRLVCDGREAFRISGRDDNRMVVRSRDVSALEGRQAFLEVYDQGTGAWGNVGVGRVWQSDRPAEGAETEARPDFGAFAIGLLSAPAGSAAGKAGAGPMAEVDASATIPPGESRTFAFAIAWRFPNSAVPVADAKAGNLYAKRFSTAEAALAYVRRNYRRLHDATERWRATWYDGSSLPHWFLERTMVNTSTLATTTAHRLATGRFWAWEGIGCCEGTCTHVWHYAQAMGRLFPSLERDQRTRVDFGVGFDPATGVVRHRAEGTGPAVDGQCGRILGVLREHQMSPDGRFLDGVWPRVKRAIEHLIGRDLDGDGLLDGAQENTLDAAWFGKIAWISSLYLAALRAGAEMARIQGDRAFARECDRRADHARDSLERELFNGEYFIQEPEEGRERSLGTYQSCHIDQVHGQSWAWQVGLGPVLDRDKVLSALRSLYRYNFAPDVGPFREKNPEGRPYALAGDGGLVMATNPKGLANPYGNASDWQFGYFNECMSGFEHQVASHMIAEGMVQEGLTVTRAIHDRYHARLRNPFNEIECSDHYARAMASYGSFVTACGFWCDGPRGVFRFDPKLRPEEFSAAFVGPEGWGVYSQRIGDGSFEARLEVRHGRLSLKELWLRTDLRVVRATVGRTSVDASLEPRGDLGGIVLGSRTVMKPGSKLTVRLTQ